MALTRVPNWHQPLDEYTRSCFVQRFKYGVLDCGLFVAGAIHALTGTDVIPDIRGTYGNRKDALEVVRSLCGRPTMEALAEHIAAKHGIEECPVAFAQCGDVVQMKRGRQSSLGIVSLLGTDFFAPSKDGIVRIPLDRATRAWHI